MIERAGWRQGVDAPRSPLGVLLGHERWLGLPAGLGLTLYSAMVFLVASPLPKDWGLALLAVAFIPFVSARKDYREPRAAAPRFGFRETMALVTKNPLALFFAASPMDGVADLVPLPTPDTAYGVEITLRKGERITGGDLGVVVFSEGWLVYEGRTTAFSLSPADVRKWWPDLPTWTIRLPEGQSLTLRSHDPGWSEAMRAWLDVPPPTGLSRLPPLTPNPIRRLRVAGYFHLGAAVLAGAALASFASKAGFRGALVFGTLTLLLYAIGAFLAWRRR